MTHSLHRKGTIENLNSDYVIIAMLAAGYNDKIPSIKKNHFRVGEILEKHGPVNILRKAGWGISSVIQACFDDIEKVKNILIELKKEELGISIVVSGLVSEIKKITTEIGLTMHTIHFSLGEFGKKSELPLEKVLEITTMCGHHCVSSQSVEYYIENIKKGKITIEKAAENLTKPCVCGIFNTKRAMNILKSILEDYK